MQGYNVIQGIALRKKILTLSNSMIYLSMLHKKSPKIIYSADYSRIFHLSYLPEKKFFQSLRHDSFPMNNKKHDN